MLTRDEAIPVLRKVLVAPITRSARRIPTEVAMAEGDGLSTASVASLDNVTAIRTSYLVRRMGHVDGVRMLAVCAALAAAVDC